METAPDKDRMLARMMRLCATRECCRSDIRRKLAVLPEAEAEAVLETLCREGFVDDARYARAFARDKSSLQGWGSLKIKLALQRKAIDAQVINAALEEIDPASAARKCEQVLRAKWESLRGEADPTRRQARFFRYALGRGYCYEEIKRIYDHLRRD